MNEPAIEAKPSCGIIMPISKMGTLSEAHWIEVRAILTESIVAAGFAATMVSDPSVSAVSSKQSARSVDATGPPCPEPKG